MRCFRLAYVALGIVVVSGAVVAADPIRVDQRALEPLSSGGVIIGVRPDTDCCDFATQVFTAGVTAPVVAISVDIAATHVTALRLAITPMLDTGDPFGLPDLSTVLAEFFVASGSASINDIWLLPQPFQQVEGHRYAIVASYPNAPAPPAPFTWHGSWQRTDTDAYAGGEPISHRTDGSWIRQLGTDARFATYVPQTPAPVPEPATLVLVGGGLVGTLLRCRKRRRAPSDSR